MVLNQEEAEIVAGFIAANWAAFSQAAEGVMSVYALHRLAEKLGLEN
ncbi:hypothetical protein J1779_21445 [Rahnella sp. FC061912-K]|nr:hypothetical protein [Rahnella rivi]MBU9832491.1 hypothetical protein [Rahnella rivi]